MSEEKKTSETPETPKQAESHEAAPSAPEAKAEAVTSDTEKPGSPEAAKEAAPKSVPRPNEKKTSAKSPVKSAAKKAAPKSAAAKPAEPGAKAAEGAAKTAAKKDDAKESAARKQASAGSASKPQSPPRKEAQYMPQYAAGGPSAASAPFGREGKGGSGFPTLLAAAALGGLIVYFLVGGWGSSGPDKNTAARLDALQTRVDQLALSTDDPEIANTIRTEINELKARVDRLARSGGSRRGSSDVAALEGGVTEVNDAIRQLESRLSQFSGEVSRNEARLTARVDNLETRMPSDLSSTLDTLTGRLSSLERNDVARDAHRAATAVALANLTRASQGSAPFSAEFEAISIIMAGDESLGELGVFAQNGLPSVGVLLNRFKGAARDIAKARRAESSWGFLGRLWANLIASVTVRPKGDIEGTSVNAILARTEVRLEEGNLGAAIGEIESLKGKPAEAAKPWLEEARARHRLNELITALNTRVIAGISADTRRALSAPAAGRTGPGSQPVPPRAEPAPADEPAAPEEPATGESGPTPDGTLQDGETEDTAPSPQTGEEVEPEPEPDSDSDSI